MVTSTGCGAQFSAFSPDPPIETRYIIVLSCILA
jgi:hypothetical protein